MPVLTGNRVSLHSPSPHRVSHRWLARNHLPALQYVQELGRNLRVEILIFSNRRFFFLVPWLVKIRPSIIDFGDCSTLYHLRAPGFYGAIAISTDYSLASDSLRN